MRCDDMASHPPVTLMFWLSWPPIQHTAVKEKTSDLNGRITVRVKVISRNGRMPTLARPGDAAFDLYSAVDRDLHPGQWAAIPTGISIEIPEGFEGQVRARSGLAAKWGIGILNGIGTIDSGYRGEVKAIMVNHGNEVFSIRKGMRICQLAIRPVPRVRLVEVDKLTPSERGSDGFGSTGM